MTTPYISVDSNKNLQLHIYVLGHYPMGESILIFVYERIKKKVHKSILIDYYEKNNINRFKAVFHKYNIDKQKLDIIIWTHPDLDHSAGLKNIIQKYTKESTYFILPDSLTRDIIKSDRCKREFDYLLKYEKSHRFSIERAGSSTRQCRPVIYEDIYFHDGITDPINFNLEILTPFSNHVFRKTQVLNTYTANDISLSILIHFGKLNFYFGGDSENGNINEINDEKLRGLDFIKIPHHGSDSSDNLVSKIGKYFLPPRYAFSVCTGFTFGRTNLPDSSVLSKYQTISDYIYLTDNSTHINEYGMWKFVYNILDQQVYKPEPLGDTDITTCRAAEK